MRSARANFTVRGDRMPLGKRVSRSVFPRVRVGAVTARARLILLMCLGAPAQVFAQKTVDVKLGEWRASYSLYSSPAAVCVAEPQWLAEELDSVNVMLEGFLSKGTTRNNAWRESQLPLLEEAARVLPSMVQAHEATLIGIEQCELKDTRLFPALIARGRKLVKEAHLEVGQLPELIRFTRHRVLLDRWEKDRDEAELVAKAKCVKAPAPFIYFAYDDEFGTRRWLFCDDTMVIAPVAKPWERSPADPKKATLWIQTARLYSDGQLMKAPRP